ncbi:hypothetical protein BVIR_577 [Blastochloris viridis]|uniref:Uncharacterized protein n=2 Tax=Blastochloris viridis TaxID=1079 RepID=A0A0N7IU50_BLAVI|nr:hypothetical protein BVIR_577 [Blastochloris viridis]CUU41036.1 hypothetical protein BVIRIDIS_00210 [Blastochloris viridis]
MLWQGAPQWRRLAVQAFHVRAVAAYFALLIVWALLAGYGSETTKALTLTVSWLFTGGAVAVGVFLLAAWATTRSTVITITTRRVIIQCGVVLQMTFNLPFKAIERAALRLYSDGTGDIPLTLSPSSTVNYVAMWPYVRPWRFERPEPMLRCIPDAAKVSEILANAMSAAAAARAEQHAKDEAWFGGNDGAGHAAPAAAGTAEAAAPNEATATEIETDQPKSASVNK